MLRMITHDANLYYSVYVVLNPDNKYIYIM